MIEKPPLSDEAILDCLASAYGVGAAAASAGAVRLEFLPLGNDATSWVYRVSQADGREVFLKVRQGAVYPPSLGVPRFLHDEGIAEVVAPLATHSGALSQPLGEFTLILYPFIAGRTGMEAGLTDDQWDRFGQVLRRIHTVYLPGALRRAVRRETFRPAWGATVGVLQARVAQGGFQEPVERALADFWRTQASLIGDLTARCVALGEQLRAQKLPAVLCHTDIHTANLLVDEQGNLHIVDWDQPLLAPIERDLTFVLSAVNGRVQDDRREQRLFLSGYGPAPVSALALAYYQYEWAVQEIGDDGQRVLLTHGLGVETRQAALDHFIQLFQPGDVVECALESGW